MKFIYRLSYEALSKIQNGTKHDHALDQAAEFSRSASCGRRLTAKLVVIML